MGTMHSVALFILFLKEFNWPHFLPLLLLLVLNNVTFWYTSLPGLSWKRDH